MSTSLFLISTWCLRGLPFKRVPLVELLSSAIIFFPSRISIQCTEETIGLLTTTSHWGFLPTNISSSIVRVFVLLFSIIVTLTFISPLLLSALFLSVFEDLLSLFSIGLEALGSEPFSLLLSSLSLISSSSSTASSLSMSESLSSSASSTT